MNLIINKKLASGFLLLAVATLFTPSDSKAVVGISTDNSAEVNITSETSTSSKTQTDAVINTGLETRAGDASTGVRITSASQVSSETDLAAFSETLASEKSAVAKIETSVADEGESKVEVVYKHRGKLLGFIPVTYKSFTTVTVTSEAEVEVESRPSIWAFLVVKEDYSRANLESEIKNKINAEVSLTTNADAETRAQVVEAVVMELQAHTEAQVAAGR